MKAADNKVSPLRQHSNGDGEGTDMVSVSMDSTEFDLFCGLFAQISHSDTPDNRCGHRTANVSRIGRLRKEIGAYSNHSPW